jgi:ABC-2 type transport system permease protein
MNLTIARITIRGLLGRTRFLLLLPLPVILVGLTTLAHTTHPDRPHDWAPGILSGFGFAVLLPLIALIVGTGVLGAEIEDGTIAHILTKPLPRSQIILAKLAVAVLVTTVVSAVPMFIAGVITDSMRLGAGLVLACLVGALAYCALFLLLSLVTRRPVLLGLLYVLLWEGLLGNLLAGTRALSVEQYVLTLASRASGTTLLDSYVSLPVSIAMSVVFLLAGTLLAINRLRSFSLTGETS